MSDLSGFICYSAKIPSFPLSTLFCLSFRPFVSAVIWINGSLCLHEKALVLTAFLQRSTDSLITVISAALITPASCWRWGIMGDDRRRTANYLIAVYIVVPVLLIALLLLIVYIVCSRRYKLNWFERSLLEEQNDGEGYTIRPALRKSAGSLAGTRGCLKFGWPGGTAAAKMGSTPSSPSSDIGEKFWVPPNVMERKRAQSLVPSLMYHGSEDGGYRGRVNIRARI